MPKVFTDCVKNGGTMFTVEIGKNKYVHGCKPKGGGKAVYGEVKTKKSNSDKK